MRITITTQPLALVALEEAKVALGESGSDRDELITTYLGAAQAELDGPKGWAGVFVASQSVEARFDAFSDATVLPGVTVIDPVTITYLDADGAEQTLSDTVYTLLGAGRLVRTPDESWPAVYSRAEAVTAVYDVGITDDDDVRLSLMKTAIIIDVKMMLDMDDVEIRRTALENIVSTLRPSAGF